MYLKHLWPVTRKGTYTPMPSKRIRGAGVVEVSADELLRSPVVLKHLQQARRIVANRR